jgi:hypothetical protein
MKKSNLAFLTVLFFATTSLAGAAASSSCYSFANSMPLDMEVMRQAIPPEYESGTTNFPDQNGTYPVTIYTAQNTPNLTRAVGKTAPNGTHIKGYAFLWANRCIGIKGGPCPKKKSNPINSPAITKNVTVKGKTTAKEVRLAFTSVAKANACTIARAAYILGYSADFAEDIAVNNKIKLYSANAIQEVAKTAKLYTASSGEKHYTLADICVLPETQTNVDGIVLDYEVHDNRAPVSTTNLIGRIGEMAREKGKGLIIYTNSIDKAGVANGLTRANLKQVIADSTGFTFVALNTTDYSRSMNIIKQSYLVQSTIPYSKLFPTLSLRTTTLADANRFNQIIRNNNLFGASFWRDGATLDEQCTSNSYKILKCVVEGCNS